MVPFHNYRPGPQRPAHRIKDRGGNKVAGGRSNAGLAGTGDLKRAQIHVNIKGTAGFCMDVVTLRSWSQSSGQQIPRHRWAQMNILGINKLHSCVL